MILTNIIIGYDKYGKPLKCGDVCRYDINGKTHRGLIIYDEDLFAFSFEQLDENFPIVVMSKIDVGTIDKLINVYSIDSNFPDGNKFVEFYNNNLFAIKEENKC